eukprot:CAMPEP_0201481944 /NCGR_PEP_ID=MMETSP0151_2-20130828/6196_1 /ASSEMBLY_ACC=CAM_ASM_000257 /TAXON_ID=200890 /ORGANISM="Paramoeba atlantica, Strain 621/1 / CCAP 1560/9" /LENGTH=153 /DNA_ID=CAMNT_0047864367 /DNA_START=63 /DNA_END=524 /DNA_ORIENTATION=+
MAVTLTVDQTSFKVALACTGALSLKYFVTLFLEGRARMLAGVRAPEDGVLGKRQQFDVQVSSETKNKLTRWHRIVGNDLENIPVGLIVIWSTLLVGLPRNFYTRAVVVFTVGRFLHTITYAKGLMPHRAICHLAAVGSIVTLLGASLKKVFRD